MQVLPVVRGFFVSIFISSTYKLGEAVILKFQIAQHSRDSELMKSLVTNFECGRIELNLGRSAVYLVVTKFKDITEKIILFFDKYPLQGVKVLDFSDFKRVAELMKNKAHLTEQGLCQIRSIKSKMNLLRDFD
jgi:hypothetical protein